MFRPLKVFFALLGAVAVAVLAGCGGGSSSSTPSTSVSGVAGTGAPVIGGSVQMVCAGGTAGTTVTTGTDGSFTVTATGAAPCVIKVSGGSIIGGGSLYSVVASSGQSRAHVNQLTNMIAAIIAGGDPGTVLFNAPSAIAGKLTVVTYNAAKKQITDNVIAILGAAVGISTSFDPVEGAYSADGTGFDKLLDNVSITLTSTTVSIVFKPTGAALVTVTLSSGVATVTTTTVISSGSLADLGGLKSFQDVLKSTVFATTTNFSDLTAALNALSNVISTSGALFTTTANNGLFAVSGSGVAVKTTFAAFASRTSQAPTLTSIIGSLSNGLGRMNVGLNFSDTAGTNSSIAATVDRTAAGSTSSAWRLSNITP